MSVKFIKRCMILFISMITVSCASNPINIGTSETIPNQLIPVADNRPDAECETRSPKIGGASYYPGDDKFQPNIIESLQIALTKKIGSMAPKPEISIEHSQVLNFFGKHGNDARRQLTGTFLPGGIVKDWLEEERFENSNFVSCEIMGKVNGEPFTATYAEPYDVKSLAYLVVYKGPDANKATETVVKKCVEITAEKISATLTQH